MSLKRAPRASQKRVAQLQVFTANTKIWMTTKTKRNSLQSRNGLLHGARLGERQAQALSRHLDQTLGHRVVVIPPETPKTSQRRRFSVRLMKRQL